MKTRFYSLLIGVLFTALLSSSITAETVGDYDGDGKTDFIVKRFIGSGNNFLQYWFTLNSQYNKFNAVQWGYTPADNSYRDDMAVMEDFDGDGKTDIGIWRTQYTNDPVPTYYYILRSSDNTLFALQWGLNSDRQVAQDYDGDGKADPAVLRFSQQEARWYVYGSRDGYFSVGMKPGTGVFVRGDYNGDGRADYALVDVPVGNIQYYRIKTCETCPVEETQFGFGLQDFVVPGDYDGDGTTDLAVWRGATDSLTGYWYWERSSDKVVTGVRFGTGRTWGDLPVPGDYDGDGKTDPAIYRANQGTTEQSYFYVLGSTSGFYGVPWGNGRDVSPLFETHVHSP